MGYFYLDPRQVSDPHTLPSIFVWKDVVLTVECSCGNNDVPATWYHEECPSCGEREVSAEAATDEQGVRRESYFYVHQIPGHMPDSDWFGPYDHLPVLLREAREGTEMAFPADLEQLSFYDLVALLAYLKGDTEESEVVDGRLAAEWDLDTSDLEQYALAAGDMLLMYLFQRCDEHALADAYYRRAADRIETLPTWLQRGGT